MADFTTGSMIQITITDDTVYVAVDGAVLIRASAPIITVNMTQDHRPPQRPDNTP